MVVARNLGHADTRMVERHYGHLAPSYIADAIRAAAPKFGIKPERKVVSCGRSRWRMSCQDSLQTLESDLCRALDECHVQYGISIDEARNRLTNVPQALILPDDKADELLNLDLAGLLRVSQGKPGGEVGPASWEQLNKKERRSAKKLAAYIGSARLFPRQRPSEINIPLALYLVFALEELFEKKLPLSRPASGGTPRGPAFRAVLAAMALAQARAEPYAGKPRRPSNVGLASIIEITKTNEFDHLLRQQGFERTSGCVFWHGNSIALTVALARKRIVDARKARRKKLAPTY